MKKNKVLIEPLGKPFYKRANFYLMVLALVATVFSLFNYMTTGATQYNKSTLSEVALTAEAVALIIGVITLLFDMVAKKRLKGSRWLKYAVYLLLLYAFAYLIVTEINFIGNVFVATDPVEPIYVTNYLTTMISLAIGMILALFAAIAQKNSKI